MTFDAGPRDSWITTLWKAIFGPSLRQSVLRRFAIIATIALVAAVAAFGFALDAILIRSASDLAVGDTSQVVAALEKSTPEKAALTIQGNGHTVQIVDASGRTRARAGAATDTNLVTPSPTITTKTTTDQQIFQVGAKLLPAIVATRRATDSEGHTYYVAVAVSVKDSGDVVDRSVIVLSLVALSLLTIAAWGLSRVITRSLAPVERIRAEVAGITDSRSAARVTVPETHDEIARLATTMNSMLDRLDEADRNQRVFISDASHELRSPLTTIRLLSESASPTAESNAVIHSEALRLQGIVEDMLLLAKADDGHLALKLTEIDLDDLVFTEARRLRRVTPHNVIMNISPARLNADGDRLGQVIRNLMDNAARHASSAIRIGVNTQDGQAVVTVENDGSVIPEVERTHIFDRFVRLDEARNREAGGSGLGLAIAHAICAAHGGSIAADASPDGWCRFTVRLPLAPSTPERHGR